MRRLRRLPLRLERLWRLRRLWLRRLLLDMGTLPRLLVPVRFRFINRHRSSGRVSLDPAGPVSFAISLLIFDLFAADTH
jgi:hypothetical protein